MRILHVIQPPRGGAVVAMLLLAREQAKCHDVGIVCHEKGDAAAIGASAGATIWALPIARRIEPFRDFRFVWKVRRILREFEPDVIHAHSSKAGVIGRLAAIGTGIPIVLSPQNFAFLAYEGGPLVRGVFYVIERLLAPLTSCLHAVSRDEYDNALRVGVGPRGRSVMIHNGIDVEPLLALPEPEAKAVPTIGTYARHFPQKRLDLLVDAFAELDRRGVPFRGLIVGDGPLREEWETRARTLGLERTVTFDSTPHDAVDALRRIDIFVLSSSHDSCPLTVMEAMAAGRPVVATAVGAVPEIVAHDSSGLLVPFGRVELLADELERLVRSEPARRRLARAAREKAARRFGANVMSARIETLYGVAAVPKSKQREARLDA